MNELYRGKIQHSPASIRILFKTAYYTFHIKRVVLRFVAGGVLVLAGLVPSFPDFLQLIFLAAGCWFLVSADFPSKIKADRTVAVRKSALPVLELFFYDEYMELRDTDSMQIAYRDVKKIVEEQQYYFFIVDENSICMIERNTVSPDDVAAFKRFVSEKTQLEWKERASVFTMSFRDVWELLSKNKKN
jgi:hypothetical protein